MWYQSDKRLSDKVSWMNQDRLMSLSPSVAAQDNGRNNLIQDRIFTPLRDFPSREGVPKRESIHIYISLKNKAK